MGQVYMRDATGRRVAEWSLEEWVALQSAMNADDRPRAEAIYAAGIVTPAEFN